VTGFRARGAVRTCVALADITAAWVAIVCDFVGRWDRRWEPSGECGLEWS